MMTRANQLNFLMMTSLNDVIVLKVAGVLIVSEFCQKT